MIQVARMTGQMLRLLLVLLIGAAGLLAQKSERERKVPEQPAAAQNATDTSAAHEDPLFKGMKYRVIGPFRGGRSLTASGIAGDPTTYYFGATGGGVWKTTDGAVTWKSVFDKQGTSSIGSLSIAPSNPNIVYVGTGEACIRGNISHGDGIYKTLDGGKTWKNIGLRDSRAIGRVIVDPKNADIVFVAALGHPFGSNSERGIFRTTDGGKTWEKVLYKDDNTGGIDVAFDPRNSNILFASLWEAHRTPWSLVSGGPGSGLYRSNDGGSTWKRLEEHGLPKGPYGRIGVAVAANSDRVYVLMEAHEGGLYRSDDGGKTWTNELNQPTAQFYHVITDTRSPYFVYGAQQDNSTIAIASRSDSATIDRADWYDVGGGEAGYIAPYPPDPNIVYAGDYQGKITRFDKRTGQLKNITVNPEISDGEGAANLEHRFQWTAPIVISPNDPNTLYHAGERLFKTTDGGTHWEAISPDLTRNDKSKQQPSGGPINIDDTGTEYYDTIFAVAESPVTKDLIWAGTDDGLIHVTRDGGKNWVNVTPKDLPEWSRISQIDASPLDAGTAYVAVDRHQNDDVHPYIFKTGDYGKTWTKLTKGIPDNTFVRAVREDPKRRGLLYAGTETGAYVSFNDGADWRSLQLNLPTTPIHDLVVKNDDLVVATHGRSFWILDDLSPLRQFNDEVGRQSVYLYAPATAYRMHNVEDVNKPVVAGENPPPGAVVYYYVKDVPKGEVTIEILDSTGNVVRRYSSQKTDPPDEPRNPEDKKQEKQIKLEAGLNL